MNIRVLRYFLTIADLGTITGAARFLHVSQPTLSKQISDLEDELQVKLFERGHREITLTEEGRYLQTRAKEIIQLVDKTTYTLQTDHNLIGGELDIGAGESIGMERILKVVSGIQKDYPAVKIRLHSGDAAEVEHKLTAGLLDFGVIMGTRNLSQYKTLKLPEADRWGLIFPKNDLLARKEVITPQDLIDRPIILSEQAFQRQRFRNWWQGVDGEMNIVGTYNLLFNATLLVKNRSCYALAFENLIAAQQDEQLTFRPLEPALTDPITLIWQNNSAPSSVAVLFLKRLKANLADTPQA